MKEINGHKYYDEDEVELIRLYSGMGRHLVHLKNGQNIDIVFDASNVYDNNSEKIIYWRYKNFPRLGYRLSVAGTILRNEVVAIEWKN